MDAKKFEYFINLLSDVLDYAALNKPDSPINVRTIKINFPKGGEPEMIVELRHGVAELQNASDVFGQNSAIPTFSYATVGRKKVMVSQIYSDVEIKNYREEKNNE